MNKLLINIQDCHLIATSHDKETEAGEDSIFTGLYVKGKVTLKSDWQCFFSVLGIFELNIPESSIFCFVNIDNDDNDYYYYFHRFCLSPMEGSL